MRPGERASVGCASCWPSSRPRRSTASTAGSSGSRSMSPRGCPGSRSSASPTPRSRRPANASAARCATPGSSIRRAGSRSTSRRPTCARPARRSTWRWPSGSCSARSRSAPVRRRLALIGELSLGGEVRSVPGVLPMVAALARRGLERVVVAAAAVDEARLVDGVEVCGVETLRRGGRASSGSRRAPRRAPSPPRIELVDAATRPTDDVTGTAAERCRRGAASRTSARSAASSRRGAGSRSRSPAVTACC